MLARARTHTHTHTHPPTHTHTHTHTAGDFVDVCFSRTSKNSGETYALSADGFLLAFDSNRTS
jgi:hypothetical protein